MNKKLLAFATLLLILFIAVISSHAQIKYKDNSGLYVGGLHEIGYRFGNHIDLSASILSYELLDENQLKVGMTGRFTGYLNKNRRSWGYSADLSLFTLTERTSRNSVLTPVGGFSLFKRITFSPSLDIVPEFRSFVGSPELSNLVYGGELSVPLSIRVFGDKRFIIGPGIVFGRTDAGSRTLKQFGLTLGFNF